jgi:hypothetical protein
MENTLSNLSSNLIYQQIKPVKAKAHILCIMALIIALFTSAYSQGGVKGIVRQPSGAPIPRATIIARQSDKEVKSVTSDEKGRFMMDGLKAGTYSFVFDADGFERGMLQGIVVKEKKIVDLGDRLILRRDRGQSIIINGSIFFKEGTSLPGAKILIEELVNDGTSVKLTTLYTNMSGEFTYLLPERKRKLKFTASYKGATGSKELEVDTAAVYRFAITLDVSQGQK